MSRPILTLGVIVGMAGLVLGACGDDGAPSDGAGEATVAVTTSVLGDVVADLVGDLATVETVMPPGADPHTFQASAQQVAAVADADALVVNGAGFEEGVMDAVDAAGEVPTFAAIDAVDTLPLGQHDHDGHDHDDHDGHDGEDGHDEEGGIGVDPHFFTDPGRMHDAAAAIADFLAAEVPGLDTAAFRSQVDASLADLEALDDEIRAILDPIPAPDRVLVTDHEVFGYFADAYDFDVVGVVVPGGGTSEGVGGADLAALVEVVRSEEVPAVFASSASTDVVETLADEAGVEVVELYAESLGPAGSPGATYPDMQRTNAERIAGVLGPGRA